MIIFSAAMHQKPTLKDLYNSTQNFEMKTMQKEREKKKAIMDPGLPARSSELFSRSSK